MYRPPTKTKQDKKRTMLENIDQIWVILGVITGIIGTASGWIAKHYTQIKLVAEKALNKDLAGTITAVIDLMSSDVPQTEEQTALITSGVVPETTWKMTDAAKDQLFHNLRDWGAEIRKDDLLAVIAKAESKSQVEYGIILYDHAGNIDRSVINKGKGSDQEHEVYHAFVSYGTPTVQNYTDTMAKVTETTSKTYSLETYWYMTEYERSILMSEIGTSPACIAKALSTIQEAETKQTERYYITCSSPSVSWEITKGNITNRWGGSTEPVAVSTVAAESSVEVAKTP